MKLEKMDKSDYYSPHVLNLSKYEKYMLCKYLLKLLEHMDTDCYNFKRLIWNLINILDINKEKYPELFKSNKNNIIPIFTQIIKKNISKYKTQNLSITNCVKTISILYSLNKCEQELLQFCIFKETVPIFRHFLELIDSYSDDLYIFCKYYLNLKNYKYKKLKNDLLEKSLLENVQRSIKISERITDICDNKNIKTKKDIQSYLLGKPEKSDLQWPDFDYIDKDRDLVLNILENSIKNKKKGINILLYGAVGTGKTQFAKLVSNRAKVKLYPVIVEYDRKEVSRKDRLADLASKQCLLSNMDGTCILFDEAEDVMNRGFGEYGSASKGYLNQLLDETPVPVFWTTNNIHNVDSAFLRRMTYAIEFKKLTDNVRLKIWERAIRQNKLKVDKSKLIELNQKYEISPSLIVNAITTTKLINGNQDDFETFVKNTAKIVNKKNLIKKKNKFNVQDYNYQLVNADFDIKNLTEKIKSSGKLNFSMCLFGEPGTGKSLYARHLANELGVEFIMKRASDLMSPYVGETEQNIAKAFAEAKDKNAMLIIDEVDTFLRNRNNAVRSWEVSQVNEMLTWMESFEQPFVCTTNLQVSLDEASLRRFTFKIKFDYMTPQQVNLAMEHFFDFKNTNVNIKGLTAGDFATVKKKAGFLDINAPEELINMLQEEVKVKRSETLKNTIGF